MQKGSLVRNWECCDYMMHILDTVHLVLVSLVCVFMNTDFCWGGQFICPLTSFLPSIYPFSFIIMSFIMRF